MNQPDVALAVGAISEKGLRDENQDKMLAFWTPMGMVYIVADGMGGHRGGAEAARRVIEGYQVHLGLFREGMDTLDILRAATQLTNADILAEGRSGDPSVAGMGSTVVMALARPTPSGMEILIAHIGDSRAYLFREGSLRQLTRDHSVVQGMIDEGLITVEAGRTHRSLNVLSRALGKQAEVELEVGQPEQLLLGDVVFLCTDGLWGHVTEEQMVQQLSLEWEPAETAEALVHLALVAGSEDNITVQILRLQEQARFSFESEIMHEATA